MHTTARIYHFLEIICALSRNWFKNKAVKYTAYESIRSVKVNNPWKYTVLTDIDGLGLKFEFFIYQNQL